MKQSQKIDVLPWVASAALVLAVAAIAVAVVAVAQSGKDGVDSTGMGGMSMGHMGHMEPLSTEGITNAPSSKGNRELSGVREDGTLTFKLEARPVWWRLYGDQKVAAWAYNGTVPGPLIRVKNGERVRIDFTNKLPEETTVHWHGIGVPNSQDGVPDLTQKPIRSGESYTYEFKARPAGDPNGGGTFIYHTHVDEDRQMPAGLAGAFIIEPAKSPPPYSTEQTLVVSEMTADPQSGHMRGVMDMEGMHPNFFTINGKSFPDTETVRVEAGEKVLLRLVNAGQLSHPLHLHGTAFEIVARDGHPTGDSSLRDTVTLASGERADIAFKLPPGKWLFHCHIGHHMTNNGETPGGLMTVVEAS